MIQNITKKVDRRNGVSTLKWIVILIIVIALAFLVYVLVKINQPASTTASEQLFEVPRGASAKQVAASLEGDELVSRAVFFELYLSLRGGADRLQAGKYVLSRNMSVKEIADKLLRGEATADVARLTVIEGWSTRIIAARLEELNVPAADGFLDLTIFDFAQEFDFLAQVQPDKPLEGFLFPDTYFISREADAQAVARKMLSNFEKKVMENSNFKPQNSKLGFYETLTLASIIEREVGRNVQKGTKLSDEEIARLAEERRKVASVFLNRLAEGMRLESDATVTYITGSKSPRATIAETRIDSPYNTYRNTGLPPTPISSPSLDSLLAVVEPADTEYLYFLTSPDGTAYFAETFEGHQRNRERHLE